MCPPLPFLLTQALENISCRIPIENVARVPQVIWCNWAKAEEDDLPIWSVHLGGKTLLKTNNSRERMKTGIQEVEIREIVDM